MMDTNLVQPQSIQSDISFAEMILKIKSFFTFLLKKWKLIVALSCLGASLGLVYAISQKKTYLAVLSFAMEDDKGATGLTGALGLASQFGFDLGGGSGGGAFAGANLIELIKSRRIILPALLNKQKIHSESVSLFDLYSEATGLKKEWETKLKKKISLNSVVDGSKLTREQDSLANIVIEELATKYIKVQQKDKKVSIINIEVRSINESFSKFFCETLADEVTKFYIDTKSKKARSNLEILERQTDSVKIALNNAIEGVAFANDETFNLNPAFNVRRVPSTKRQIDLQTSTAVLTELMKNLELARISVRKETPLIQIIDSPVFPLKIIRPSKKNCTLIGGGLFFIFTIAFLGLKQFFNALLKND